MILPRLAAKYVNKQNGAKFADSLYDRAMNSREKVLYTVEFVLIRFPDIFYCLSNGCFGNC
jgi:hypothetical protein